MNLTEEWMRDIRYRIEMTVGCRDCDDIPKVEQAGFVLDATGTKVQIMHNGLRIVADSYCGAWMTEIISRLKGHHEPQEEKVFHEILKYIGPNATMIELGGYWSYYSMWFLQHAPRSRRSIIVEPNADNLAVGKTNAALNGFDIEFLHAYLGDPMSPETRRGLGFADAEHASVPDLMSKLDIASLDILHCDTQGAETTVLTSCADLIESNRISFCVVSTHSHHISGDPLTHQKCLAILRKAGAKIIAEHDVHESFSGDGLIVAFSGREPVELEHVETSLNRYSTSLFRNPLFDLDDSFKSQKAAESKAQSLAQTIGAKSHPTNAAGPSSSSRQWWGHVRDLRETSKRLFLR